MRAWANRFRRLAIRWLIRPLLGDDLWRELYEAILAECPFHEATKRWVMGGNTPDGSQQDIPAGNSSVGEEYALSGWCNPEYLQWVDMPCATYYQYLRKYSNPYLPANRTIKVPERGNNVSISPYTTATGRTLVSRTAQCPYSRAVYTVLAPLSPEYAMQGGELMWWKGSVNVRGYLFKTPYTGYADMEAKNLYTPVASNIFYGNTDRDWYTKAFAHDGATLASCFTDTTI